MKKLQIVVKYQDDYIRKYLINEIGQIMNDHQELSWVLMVAGVELLGRCVSLDLGSAADKNSHSSKPYFRAGLKLLGNKYEKLDDTAHDLYKFRNGLCHLTFSVEGFAISERVNKSEHLSVDNGKLILVAEDFYEDFKVACEKVIEMRRAGQIGDKFHIEGIKSINII